MKKYAPQVSAYIEAAKKCPGSNGDASRTIDTTFPATLMPVAQHEFGFNAQYGDTRPASALVSHGFARTSPEVYRRGPEAIEYVVFAIGLTTEVEERTSLGNWRLRIDTSAEPFKSFQKTLQRQGLDTYFSSVDIDMRRAPQASALPKASSLANELSEMIASRFEREGFEEMSDADLRRNTGKSRDEMSKEFSKNVSFGARSLLNGKVPTFKLLMKSEGIPCTRSGRGAVGTYLFSLDGDKDVPVDFGSISAMVIGFGTCASTVNSSRQYIRNLTEETKQAILDDLALR